MAYMMGYILGRAVLIAIVGFVVYKIYKSFKTKKNRGVAK